MTRHAFHGSEREKPQPWTIPYADQVAGTMFDRAVCPTSKRRATPASSEAAALAYLRSYTIAEASLRLLAISRPMTSNECADVLGEDEQSVRPRFSQMKARGWLQASKETRPTGHGGASHVHRITEAGRAILTLLSAAQREKPS